MRVLAIDPSLRCTGYAVLAQTRRADGRGFELAALTYGTIVNPATRPQTACFAALHRGVRDLVDAYHPDACAIEATIFVQSFRTAILLGAARGALLSAVALAEIPIYEYAPRRVKQAIAGRGAAQKAQVAFMVRSLLGLTTTPSADAADALAVGITHLQASKLTRNASV